MLKKVAIGAVVVLGVMLVVYAVVFVGVNEVSGPLDGGRVKILGKAPRVRETSSLESRSIVDRCLRPKPECVEMFRIREKMVNYFDPDYQANADRITECVASGCLQWDDDYGLGGEIESETVDLSGRGVSADELTQIFEAYVKEPWVSNLRLQIENGMVIAVGEARLSLFSGRFSVWAEVKSGDFEIVKVWIGRVPLSQQMVKQVNQAVRSRLDDYLVSLRIDYNSTLLVEGDRLYLKIEAPKGLVRVDGENSLVIDNSVFEKYGLTPPDGKDNEGGVQKVL